jgi:xanthine dehydrogenase YagS FAD-binding subunit
MLVGKRLDEATLQAAAGAELEPAKPYRGNAFKVELAERIVRAVTVAASIA